MPNPIVGIGLAAASSVPFAAYILPRKLCRLPVLEYQYWLGFAVVPVCVLLAILADAPLWGRADLLLWSAVCGPIWVLGSLSYSSAVDCIGVARSTPVKNFAPAFASLYGIVLFHEYTISRPLYLLCAVAGLLLMLAAAWILGGASAPSHETALAFLAGATAGDRKRAFVLGWIYSFGAAFFYGLYAAPLKIAVARGGLNPFTACVYLGLGVWIAGVLIYAAANRKVSPPLPSVREFSLTQYAGSIWAVAQVMGTAAMVQVAMAISWPTANLGTLIAVCWGVFIFKEVDLKSHLTQLWISLALYLIGLGFLIAAAPHGRV